MSPLEPTPRLPDAPPSRDLLAWPEAAGSASSPASARELLELACRLRSLALRWGHLPLVEAARVLARSLEDPGPPGDAEARDQALARVREILREEHLSLLPVVAHVGTHPLPPLPGIPVERVGSGDALFGLLGRERVGLVVLEVTLPDEDGRSILARLREDPAWGEIPVLALEHVGDAAVPDLLMLGVGDVLVEPVDPEALVREIRARHPATTASLPEVRPRRPPRFLSRAEFRTRVEEAPSGPLHLGRLSLDRFTALLEDRGSRKMLVLLEALARRVAHLDEAAPGGGSPVCPWETGGFHMLLPGRMAQALEHLEAIRVAVGADEVEGVRLSLSGTVEPLAERPGGRDLDHAMQACRQRIFEVRMAGGGRIVPPGDPAADPEQRPPLHLLVVDDDETTTAIVRHRFEREGFEVEAVPDGVDALERLEGDRSRGRPRPDLMVLDWHLPGMDGIQVLEGVRRNPLTAPIPVIMLTGRSRDADLARAFAAGADDYLLKPFSPVELVARCRRLLSWNGQSRTPAR